MDGAVAECTPEQVNRNIDGATITSIASVYAHTVFAEDFIVHMMLQGKPPIYEAQGWSKKLNVAPSGAPPSINPEWAKAIKMDVPSFQQYAKEVYAASDAYVASLPDAELERKVQTPAGEQTVGWALAVILGTHGPQHMLPWTMKAMPPNIFRSVTPGCFASSLRMRCARRSS